MIADQLSLLMQMDQNFEKGMTVDLTSLQEIKKLIDKSAVFYVSHSGDLQQ